MARGTRQHRFKWLAALSFNLLARPLLSLMQPARRTRMVARSLNLTRAQAAKFQADLERIDLDLVSQINQLIANQPSVAAGPIPALITAGAVEIGPVKKRARMLVDSIPGARGFIVRDVGHAWCLEAPDLFQQTVRA